MPPTLKLTPFQQFQLEFAEYLPETLKKFGKLNDEQKLTALGGVFLSHYYESSDVSERNLSLTYAKALKDLDVDGAVAHVLEEIPR